MLYSVQINSKLTPSHYELIVFCLFFGIRKSHRHLRVPVKGQIEYHSENLSILITQLLHLVAVIVNFDPLGSTGQFSVWSAVKGGL